MPSPRSMLSCSLLLASLLPALACSQPPAAQPSSEQEAAIAQAPAEVAPAGTPTIASPEATFDFGTLEPGEKAVHVFKIENRGTADLHIERVERTWGCTASVISADVIPPGGEGEIKVTLTPKNGQESITKHITVLSDDPAQPRFTLTMQGKMRVDLRALPANIQIRDLQPGAEGKARFEVHITDPRLTEIISVEVEDKKNFAVEPLPGTDETGIKHFYELRFFGQKEIGSIGSRVEIATTSPDTPLLLIPIRATVASNLRYAKRVQFVRRNGSIQQRPIRISTRDGKDPEIGKVEDPDGLLKLSVGKPDRGAVVIAASVDEEKLAGLDEAAQRAQHQLIVHTGDPDEPELRITYAVTASPTEGRAAVAKPSTATK